MIYLGVAVGAVVAGGVVGWLFASFRASVTVAMLVQERNWYRRQAERAEHARDAAISDKDALLTDSVARKARIAELETELARFDRQRGPHGRFVRMQDAGTTEAIL